VSRYENGKARALIYALECAMRDREGLLDAMNWPPAEGESRDECLANRSESDRDQILRTESYLRDFKKLQDSLKDK
jgi:hypothetical protein